MAGLILAAVLPISAEAAANLTITPLTWNIIGLDSNNITVGPNHFPVGAKVCNTGDATAYRVRATFTWEDPLATSYINLRSGTSATLPRPQAGTIDLAAGACIDAYYEVEVTRNSLAYNTTRGYYIFFEAKDVNTDPAPYNLSASTPRPRELYVEHLVSQARNAVTGMSVSNDGSAFNPVSPGGTMTLMVGNTYWIKIDSTTATQGYEQIETFINFPNIIFQILDVVTTYTAETSANMSSPYKTLYGDACTWENDPNSPNYLSCLSTGKAGGTMSVTYKIKILTVPSAPLINPEPLSTLTYDFSGSSVHYNSDFGVTPRYADVVDPTNVGISKTFSPDTINPNGVTALKITLTNPNSGSISGFNFVDIFPTSPGAMTVASPFTTSNTCGGTLQDSGGGTLAAGDVGIKLINGIVAANSNCIITVNVTVPATPTTGTYTNTTENLFIDLLDSTKNATASLTVNTAPAPPPPICGVVLARWNFASSLTPTYQSSKVSTATATHNGTLVSTVPDTQNGQIGWSLTSNTAASGLPQWPETASAPPGYPLSGAAPYFQFEVDATKFTNVAITFDADVDGNWAAKANNHLYVWSNSNGGAYDGTARLDFTPIVVNTWYTNNTATASTTGSSTTIGFRINEIGAKGTGTMPRVVLDNVIISGCGIAEPPTITKAFSPNPVAVGANSTLTFTITNPNLATLSGISFNDYLPSDNLQGTVSVTNSNTAVVGAGTAFKTQLVAGSIVSIPSTPVNLPNTVSATNGSQTVTTSSGFSGNLVAGSVISIASVDYTVAAVGSDTSLTLTSIYGGATASGLTAGGYKRYTVATITDDTHLTLTATYGGTTASGLTMGAGLTLAGAPTTTCGSTVTGVTGSSAISLAPNSLAGTVAVTNGSPNVVGTGSNFVNSLAVGDPVSIADVNYTVLTITDATHIALSTNYAGATVANPPGLTMLTGSQLKGTVQVTNASANVVGTGTNFTGQLAVGRLVSINGVNYTVATITSTTAMTISPVYAGTNATGLTMTTGLAGLATCTVTASVKANAAGVRANVSGIITSTQSGNNTTSTGYATANLTAVLPPVILKGFSPDPIASGGQSTLTFTITNPNQNNALSGVIFTDTFPVAPGAMTVAAPLTTTNTCGGTLYASNGTTLLAASAASIRLGSSTNTNTGSLSAGGSCTITVKVTATTTGTYTNTTGNVAHIINAVTVNGNTATDTLQVNAVNPAIALQKQVGASSTGPWFSTLAIATGANVYYKFTVENIGDVPFTSFNVTDPTLAALGLGNPITCTWVTTNSPTTLPGLPVGTQTVDPSATCVVGPVTAISGTHPNTATAHGTYTTGSKDSTPDTATYATTGLTIAKSAEALFFAQAGDIIRYSYVVTNSGYVALVGPVTVVDNKTTVTCPAVSTVGDQDNWMDAAFGLQGTVAVTNNSAAITGTGTAFSTKAQAGTVLTIASVNYTVLSVTDDTHLTLTANYAGATVANPPGLTISAVAESITCTADYTVTAGDMSAGDVTNIASATAGGVTSNTDSVVVVKRPTRVSLVDFRAYEQNGQVYVRWETASEHNTLGFNLLRLDPVTEKYEAVNSGLMPGIFKPHRGGIYTLTDSRAIPGGTYTYKLIEVENSGKQLSYGPFMVSVDSTLTAETVVPGPSGYDRRAKGETEVQKTRIKTGKAALIAASAGTITKTAPGNRIKISVAANGIYYMDASDISSLLGISLANVSTMISSGQLSLSSQGKQAAYMPSVNNTGIYFYGTGIESNYAAENIYWLEQGKGTIMPVMRGKGPGPSAEGESFTETLHFEQNLSPWEQLFNDPNADYWLWAQLFASSFWTDPPMDFPFEAPGLSEPDNTATIQLHLLGGSDAGVENDHHVKVRLNGVQMADERWSGLAPYTITFTAPVTTGQNILTIQGEADLGVSWSQIFVNSFDVTYQRLYEASGNRLTFRGDGQTPVTVEGFTSPDIMVFDVTNPLRPKLNTATTVEPDTTGYMVSLNPASATTTYFSVTGSEIQRLSGKAVGAFSLSSKNNAADYIIIAPDRLIATAQVLADYRKAQGYKTMVVDIENIINEFNYGLPSPEAIHKFLSHAYSNWMTAPRYVVLAGNGSMDYKDYLGHGGNLIPSRMVPTGYGLFVSDNSLADFNGDRVPEIAIGRLPVTEPGELLTVINKIKTYESTPRNNIVVLLADTPDVEAGDFIADSESLATVFPANYILNKIYLSDPANIHVVGPALVTDNVDIARSTLIATINNGVGFFNYVGHAGPNQLSNSGLIYHYPEYGWDDLPLFTNAGLFPVMTAMTCLVGNFSDPYSIVLAEALVSMPGGGVAAAWAPTGLSDDAQASILNREFYMAFISGGKAAIGDLVRQALSAYKIKGTLPFMMDIYNILGDPALRIR